RPAGRDRRPRRPDRPRAAGAARRLRPRSGVGGRPHPAGQPVPQYALRRPHRPPSPTGVHEPGYSGGRTPVRGGPAGTTDERASPPVPNRRSRARIQRRKNAGLWRTGGHGQPACICPDMAAEERRFVGDGRGGGVSAALRPEPALLVLADGAEFEGEAIGAFADPEAELGVATGEFVFNTALS